MRRYRIKSEAKSYTDTTGPDLLRTRENAISQARRALPRRGPFSGRKGKLGGGWWPWQELGSRRQALRWLEHALPTLKGGQQLQVAVGKDPRVVASARAEEIDVPDLPTATSAAELAWALFRHQFPSARFGGAFTCKRLNGSTSPSVPFSDHAWGDAVDVTQAREGDNDRFFDWGRRMAIEHLTPASYIVGSRNGSVVSARSPSWKVVAGGSSTHLWHTHQSCRQHSGTPPCAR